MNFSAEKNENYSQRDLQLKIYELSWEQFMRDLELRRQDAIRSAQEALSLKSTTTIINRVASSVDSTESGKTLENRLRESHRAINDSSKHYNAAAFNESIYYDVRWIITISALAFLIVILLTIIVYHVVKMISKKRRVKLAKDSGANALVTIEPLKKLFLAGQITTMSLDNDETNVETSNKKTASNDEDVCQFEDKKMSKLTLICSNKN